MKKLIYAALSMLLLGIFISSCENKKEPTKEEIKVSISADNVFSDENKANLTITLSSPADEDIIVSLSKAQIQTGKNEIPADFEKNVRIPKGKISTTVIVEADVLGIESGQYQAAIKIADVQGAIIGEKNIVYINLNYVYKPEVNLYADESFASNKTAKVRAVLSKATSVDVKVRLVASKDNKFDISFNNNILTIPAGNTESEVTLTVNLPENVEIGVYSLSVSIDSVEDAVMGKVTSANIGLSYPFAINITIDGNFDDWNDPNIITYQLPSGTTLYPLIKTLKLTGNEKYAYMYFEFVDPSTVDFYCKNKNEVIKGDALESNSLPLDIFIDCDGLTTTGAYVAAVDNDTYYPPYANNNMGIEWYIELGFHIGENKFNDFYPNGVYSYGGSDNDNVFSGLSNLSGTYDGSTIYAQTQYVNGVGKTEIQFNRKFFKMTNNKARFAIKIMNQNTNWSCMGLMPQAAATSMTDPETRPMCDMATLILPNYAE